MEKKNRNETILALNTPLETPASVMCNWYARNSSGVAVSGERPMNSAKYRTALIWPCWVFGDIPRMRMSSIIRSRSGVVFSSFMGTSCHQIEKPQSSNRSARSQNTRRHDRLITPAKSDITAKATSSFRPSCLSDVNGPEPTSTVSCDAATQLHQTGHSCIAQHFEVRVAAMRDSGRQ